MYKKYAIKIYYEEHFFLHVIKNCSSKNFYFFAFNYIYTYMAYKKIPLIIVYNI